MWGAALPRWPAHLLGHQCLGIDVSPDYLKYAKARLQNAASEAEKLDQELALHKIDQSFAARKKNRLFVGKHRRDQEAVELTAENLKLW